MSKKINWFWAHRRNSSLHHMSFLMKGLEGKGWLPVVNFWFDNQIVVGVPGKGTYIFYDENQLKSGAKYKDIQDSIDSDKDFVKNFHRRTDEIFGAIFFKCLDIEASNLQLLSNAELLKLYKEFLDAVMVGPIITVQLWGIEACFDEKYKIVQFLRKRLDDLKKSKEFELYRGILSINVGETVAFTEQKDFYRVAIELCKNSELRKIFEFGNLTEINIELSKFPYENNIISKHIEKYEWVNTEYVSSGWSRESWLDLFRQSILSTISPEEKLREHLEKFSDLNSERQKIIKELAPPKDVLHSLDALAELTAQRDWTKGYFTKALLSYNKLLDEIAKRIGITREAILYYSYLEVEKYLDGGETVSQKVISDRMKDGFILLIKGGKLAIIEGKSQIQKVIIDEGISEPFEKMVNVKEFKGLGASRGCVKGKARVMEDASLISDLKEGEILVTYMTTIEFIPAFRKAAAVVTDEGGMSCHAAIISREFKLPCVVGTKVATRVVRTGDEIEVDGEKGIVRILNK